MLKCNLHLYVKFILEYNHLLNLSSKENVDGSEKSLIAFNDNIV